MLICYVVDDVTKTAVISQRGMGHPKPTDPEQLRHTIYDLVRYKLQEQLKLTGSVEPDQDNCPGGCYPGGESILSEEADHYAQTGIRS
jgi:hypothetical protein